MAEVSLFCMVLINMVKYIKSMAKGIRQTQRSYMYMTSYTSIIVSDAVMEKYDQIYDKTTM